jgi:hypothetical protein
MTISPIVNKSAPYQHNTMYSIVKIRHRHLAKSRRDLVAAGFSIIDAWS